MSKFKAGDVVILNTKNNPEKSGLTEGMVWEHGFVKIIREQFTDDSGAEKYYLQNDSCYYRVGWLLPFSIETWEEVRQKEEYREVLEDLLF